MELAGIELISLRFQQDPHDGTIDLGLRPSPYDQMESYLLSAFVSFKIYNNRKKFLDSIASTDRSMATIYLSVGSKDQRPKANRIEAESRCYHFFLISVVTIGCHYIFRT